MKISIFGMGYVGCVTAACLIKQNNFVIGVDVNEHKIKLLSNGKWPIFEKGLDDLIENTILAKKLKITSNSIDAIINTEISIICVGTPSLPNGKVDLNYITRTMQEINEGLKKKDARHILLIRSTIPPGTTESILMPIIQKKLNKKNVIIGYYPEFLREGVAIKDFFNPSLHIIGCDKEFPISYLKKIMPLVKKDITKTSIKTAETIKYANNSFHALKVVFANELALIASRYDVNIKELFEIFYQDKILNLSNYYLKPGFAFGGSCLPKEVRAIIELANEKKINSDLFKGILKSNEHIINTLISLIHEMEPSSVGYFGITFKPETDDIRESPVLRAIEILLSRTASYSKVVKQIIYDNKKATAKVFGKYGNDFYIANSVNELIQLSDIIVLGPYKINKKIEQEIINSGKNVIDLKWHDIGKNLKGYSNYKSIH